jgi:flagellar biosynthesis/type III secretory pathway protein FliH
LVPGNVVSLQMGFEHAEPSDYARLLPAVAELKDAGLRRTVWEWVALRARRQGMTLEEVDVEGTYFRSRIGDNFKRATQAWFAEGVEEGLRRGREQGLEQGREQGLEQGREQGIEQGIERGLEQQRALLMRQVAAKFGADAPARVGPLLSRVADAASLAEVGEAVLVSATETELAARVEAVIAPAHRIGGSGDAPARGRRHRR